MLLLSDKTKSFCIWNSPHFSFQKSVNYPANLYFELIIRSNLCDVHFVSIVTGCCSRLQTALSKKNKTFCNQNDMNYIYFLMKL